MRFTTVIAFLMALAVGGLLLLHGFGFMAGFNTTPLPALTDLVKAGQTAGQALAGKADPRGRVVVVVVDGLRADFASHLAPKVPDGVAFASCQLETVMPSFSRPAYVALSTGVPPWASGVHTNDHDRPAALPSIWDVARKAGVKTQLVSDGTDWWVELFPEAFDQIDIVPKKDFDAFWERMPPFAPRSLVLLHIVAADDAGHDFGAGAEYRAEVAKAGRKIQRLIGELGPEDTLIVTADHGHIDRGGHGGPEPETMAIPLMVFGAGVVAMPRMNEERRDAGLSQWCGSILDIPVAVAARLDLPPPPAGLGGLPPIIRPASPAFSALLATQSVAVHDKLGAAKHDPFAHGRARAASLRSALIAIALWLALWFLVAWALVVGPRLRSLVSALVPPFLFVCAYMIFEPTLSLSAVWQEDPWTRHLALIAAICALISAVIVFRRHAPAEALMLIALGALLPFMIAALAHGSLAAGPVLGEPHAAFAIIAADLYAGVTMAVALVVAVIAFARERRRAHAKVWA